MTSIFILLFVLGLVFGSFISAVSWRIPKEISFIKGRSICPKCKKQISWYDNIPLFSYLLLDGRCRNCKRYISPRYPLIELTSGLGFIAIYYFLSSPTLQGLPLQGINIVKLIFTLTIFVILLTIFVIDLEHKIIPDSLVFTGILVVLFYSMFTNHYPLFTNLFSGFIAASFLMLVHLATKGKGMGLGDVKFAVFGGMIVGIKLLSIWLLSSFLTGAIVGIILILVGRAKMKTKIAFGPFLIIGVAVAVGFGSKLLNLFNFL